MSVIGILLLVGAVFWVGMGVSMFPPTFFNPRSRTLSTGRVVPPPRVLAPRVWMIMIAWIIGLGFAVIGLGLLI